MILCKNWGPDGIADISAAAVRVAYRRLRRRGFPAEAHSLRYDVGDLHRRDLAELIVANMGPAVTQAPARQILRQLSTLAMQHQIQAELKGRKRGNSKIIERVFGVDPRHVK